MTKPHISFHPIGPEFGVRIGFDDMDVRDQINLFNALADRLGLTEAAQERPDESYQVLWGEMMDRCWK